MSSDAVVKLALWGLIQRCVFTGILHVHEISGFVSKFDYQEDIGQYLPFTTRHRFFKTT